MGRKIVWGNGEGGVVGVVGFWGFDFVVIKNIFYGYVVGNIKFSGVGCECVFDFFFF